MNSVQGIEPKRRSLVHFRPPIVRFQTIERPRLGWPDSTPLTILHAPAGYGKSVLLSQWTASWNAHSMKSVWIVLSGEYVSEDDFWGVLAAGLGIHEDEDSLQVMEDISGFLSELTEPLIIVIDNFEYATKPSLDIELVQLLDCSPFVQLVVSGRRSSTMMSPLVTSQYAASIMTAPDLSFTPEEMRELAQVYRRVSSGRIESFGQSVGGWPLPIQVACAGSGPASEKMTAIVAEYLAWAGEGAGLKILLEIALCPGISRDALATIECGGREASPQAVLTMDANLRDVCDALEDQGLLIKLTTPDAARYTCHLGLKQVLSKTAEEYFSQSERQLLLRTYAANVEDHDAISSLRTWLALDAIHEAEQVARRHFVQLILDTEKMREVFDGVPDRVTENYAALDGLRFMIDQEDPRLGWELKRERMARRRISMRGLLNGDDPGGVLIAEASLMSAEAMLGNVAEAGQLARDLDRRMSNLAVSGASEQLAMSALLRTLIAYAATACGDFEIAEENNLHALELAKRAGNPFMHMRALRGLILIHDCTGNAKRAHYYHDQLRGLQEAWGDNSEDRSIVMPDMYIAETLMLYTAFTGWGESMEAQPVSPELVRSDVWTVSYPMLLITEAEGDRRLNGGEHALRLLKHRIRMWPAFEEASDAYALRLRRYMAKLMAVAGDLEGSRKIIDAMPDSDAGTNTALARMYLFHGEGQKALKELQSCDPDDLVPRQKSEQTILLALTLWQQGLEAEAMMAASDALRQMEQVSGYSALIWVPYSALLELAEHMRDQGVDALYKMVITMPETLRSKQFGHLSRAELRSLEELANGESLEATADALFISINTLKFHLRSIYKKLQVSRRNEAIQRAYTLGLINYSARKARV